MNNRHTLTEQEVRDALRILSEFYDSDLLLESALGNKLKNTLAKVLPSVGDNLKNKMLKGFQAIKSKIGTPSEVFADFLEVVKAYKGDLGDLQADAEELLSTGKPLKEAENKYGLAPLGKFLKKYRISNIIAVALLVSLLGGYVKMTEKGIEDQFFTTGEKANIELTMDAGSPTTDPKGFPKSDPGNFSAGGSTGGGAGPGEDQPDSDLVNTLKNQNVQGSDDLIDNDQESVTGKSLPTGEYKLDAKTFNQLEDQTVKAILDDIDSQLEVLKAKGQGPGKIIITIDPDGHISLNNAKDVSKPGGGLSNRANDGSDLLNNRGNEAKMLADLVKQKVEEIVKKLYPETEITIKVSEPTKDDLSQQKVGKKGSKEQAITVKSKVDVKGSTTIKFMQFLRPFYAKPFSGKPEEEPTTGAQGEKARDRAAGAQGEKAQDRAAGSSLPTNIGAITRVIDRFSQLNRNGQIATILKIASGGKADAFKALDKQPMTSIEEGELKRLLKSGNKEDQNLANAILNIRKNANSFLDKLAPALGVQFATRGKAAQIVPGKGPQAPLGIQESATILLEEYEQLLSEAYVEEYIENVKNLSATDKVAILAMIGSMYRQEGGEASIIDLGSLGTGYADELRKVGFAPQPQGKGYVFLGPGQTKKDFAKPQPDATAVGAAIGKNQSLKNLLQKIKTQDDLTSLVLAMFNTFKPTFVADATKVSNALNKLDDRVVAEAEGQDPDVSAIIAAIDKDSTLKGKLITIDTEEEAIQVVLSNIIPFIGDSIKNDKPKLKQALVNAFNKFRNSSQAKPAAGKSTTTTKGGFTSTSTAPGINIDNIKYVNEQQVKRFQKLAGII